MRLWLYLSAVLVCWCVFANLAIAQKEKGKLSGFLRTHGPHATGDTQC